MADTASGLSDSSLAVFAFAAYHQLTNGQTVLAIAQRDGAGHGASEDAVAELSMRGLIEADGETIRFTEQGEAALQAFVAAIRKASQDIEVQT